MSRFIDEAMVAIRGVEGTPPVVMITLSNGSRHYFNGLAVKQAGTTGDRIGDLEHVALSGGVEGVGSVALIVRDSDIYSVEFEMPWLSAE